MNKLINRVRQHKKAFTLVELVLVIVIIALLAVFLIPQLSSMTNKAKTAGVQEDFHEFQIAAQAVAYEQSGFGADESAALTFINKNLDTANQINTSTKLSTNKDPWNKEYQVIYVAESDTANEEHGALVAFISGGADGNIETDTAAKALDLTGTKVAAAKAVGDDLVTVVEYGLDGSVKVTTAGFSLNKTV